jgi:NADPH:quinone reductase
MKAWIKGTDGLELRDTDAPAQGSDELLVRVGAISLNRGEVRGAARAATGAIPGWDIAGVVEKAAPNGKGPAVGTRVAALLNSGGWAELASVPVAHAAVIPDGVTLEQAATLPIAGLTIVRAFALAGSLLGKRVLVTGARGGVGQFATQLAEMSGAVVTGVRTADEGNGPFDLILESAGGASLAAAIERVARGGIVVTISNSSEEETTFNARTLYAKGGASIYGLLVFEELESRRITGRDLERLLELVRSGRLHAPIEVQRDWTELASTLADLERRAFRGKAVLRVG